MHGLLGEGINVWQVPPFLAIGLDAGGVLLRAMPKSFPRCGELPVSAPSSMVAVGMRGLLNTWNVAEVTEFSSSLHFNEFKGK